MKIDRIKILELSGILLILSVFSMNGILLILALLQFTVIALYIMKKSVQEDKMFDYNSLSKEKKILWNAVIVLGGFGILMGFIGLFLSL